MLTWFKKKVEPVLTSRTVGWQEVIFLVFRGSCIYLFWSIFMVPTVRSRVISYLMIVLTFFKSFILNSFISWSFNHFNTLRFFDLKIRSSTYATIIISFSSYLIVKIHLSVLVGIKLIFWKNLIIFLFHNLFAWFNLYKLFSIFQTSPSWLARHLW